MRDICIRGVWFNIDDPNHEAHWDRIERGEWQPWIFSIYDRYLDEDCCCIDFGAWVGGTVLYASKKSRHCYAFEPDPVAFELLQKNVACNPEINNITLINSAIWTKTGRVMMGSETDGLGNSDTSIMLDDVAITTEVQTTRFDDFKASLFSSVDTRLLNCEDCNLIKFDIEGAEADVLEDMADYISERRPSLVLSLHSNRYRDVEAAYSIFRNIRSDYQYCYDLGDMGECVIDSKCDDYLITDRKWE